MLEDKINYYNKHEKSLNNTPAQYKSEFEWLKDVDSQALSQSHQDLNSSFGNFFKKRARFPKFKRKGAKDTYRSCVVNNNIRIEEGGEFMGNKIEFITCEEGDWEVIRVNGEVYEEGHSIHPHRWLELLEIIGNNTITKTKEISNKDMESGNY